MTHRTSILKTVCGQSASFAIKAKNSKEPVHKAGCAKGIALICKSLHPGRRDARSRNLNIRLPDDLTVGYAPVIACPSVSAPGYAKSKSKDVLRAGDRAKVVFQWLYKPGVVEEGSQSHISRRQNERVRKHWRKSRSTEINRNRGQTVESSNTGRTRSL